MITLDKVKRKKVMVFFKIILGYGYRCSKCDKYAKIIGISCDEFSYDYVNWQCPGCKKKWTHEMKENEIRNVLK